MKFSQAWADIAALNVSLKAALLSLAFSCSIGTVGLVKLSLRDPLIIDRECYSSKVKPGNPKHSKEEVQAFARLALEERFNSSPKELGYLSTNELRFRSEDLQKMHTAKLKQVVVVNSIDVKDGKVRVDADRLISTGDIRSAFPFPLELQIGNTLRTSSNPYGLVLEKVSPIVREEKKENG